MRTWLSSIALLAAACGGTSPSATLTSGAPRTDPEPPAARVHVSPMLFHLRLDGEVQEASRLEHIGLHRYVFGGWRVELLEGDRALVSEDAFISTVSDARECGDGWVFVTWRGTIAYADSFTSPARRIGTVASIDSDPRHRLRTNEGVVLYADERGGVLTGPCEGPLRPVDAVPGDIVGDV